MKHRNRRICILGLGQFGAHLARTLAADAEVLALDRDEERVAEIRDYVQQARILDVRDRAALDAVLKPGFDEAVIAMGSSLESSILCALHLKKIGVPMLRAKAVSDDHAEILRRVGVNQVIYPERETAERIGAQIVHPNLVDFVPIAEDYSVVNALAPEAFRGRSLAALDLRNQAGVFVLAVRRNGQGGVRFLPGPDYVVQPDDVLVVLGREENVMRLCERSPKTGRG
jgi:trk system potassium uptake protein TrkA